MIHAKRKKRKKNFFLCRFWMMSKLVAEGIIRWFSFSHISLYCTIGLNEKVLLVQCNDVIDVTWKCVFRFVFDMLCLGGVGGQVYDDAKKQILLIISCSTMNNNIETHSSEWNENKFCFCYRFIVVVYLIFNYNFQWTIDIDYYWNPLSNMAMIFLTSNAWKTTLFIIIIYVSIIYHWKGIWKLYSLLIIIIISVCDTDHICAFSRYFFFFSLCMYHSTFVKSERKKRRRKKRRED